MNIIQSPSPNFNDRITPIDMLIMHYTNMNDATSALARLCDPATEVSAHYMVDIDGTIHALVPEDKRAWHAGRTSWWDGENSINSRSIGIEIVNSGHSRGLPPFTGKQMKAVLDLSRDIRARHTIPQARVLGHSDVAPGRKRDPGHRFNWRWLAAFGVGLYPKPDDLDLDAAEELLADPAKLRAAFTAYGYRPDSTLRVVTAAFQRHFQREIFTDPKRIGRADLETCARLSSLLRMKTSSPLALCALCLKNLS